MPDSHFTKQAMPNSVWLRRVPIVLILCLAIAGVFFFRGALGFDALAKNYGVLIAYRDAHFATAVLAFVVIYTLIVVFALPGALVASITGGALFGLAFGGALNFVAALTGATAIFVAARAGFGADVAAKLEASGGTGARLQSSIQRNEWSALLTMRLVPVVPFFVANLIPAFMGIKLRVFFLTTALGIIPGCLIYTWVGSGLSDVLAQGKTPDLSILGSPNVLGPLVGLGLLAALPMLLRMFRKGEQ